MRETPGRAPQRWARAAVPLMLALSGCTGIGGEAPPPPVDDADAYYLPFEAGTARTVGQSNFGVAGLGSHADNYAIDFIMPTDTPVLAARRGVVVDVRADCPDVNCPFDPERCCGNFVRVRHDDGTIAIYLHLRYAGVCVRRGDVVARGDVLARSGNTGRSLGPHLHFAVFAAPGETGSGSRGPSTNGSMEVRFADVGADGVPAFLVPYRSRNEIGFDWCPR